MVKWRFSDQGRSEVVYFIYKTKFNIPSKRYFVWDHVCLEFLGNLKSNFHVQGSSPDSDIYLFTVYSFSEGNKLQSF